MACRALPKPEDFFLSSIWTELSEKEQVSNIHKSKRNRGNMWLSTLQNRDSSGPQNSEEECEEFRYVLIVTFCRILVNGIKAGSQVSSCHLEQYRED